MKYLNVIIAAILGAAVTALVLNQLGLLQLSENSSAERSSTGQVSTLDDTAQSGTAPANVVKNSISLEDIRQLIASADPNQRQALVADENAFREFVQQEAMNLSLLAAAKANALDTDPQVKFIIERRNDITLRELYLNRLINNNMPAEFPSVEQVRQYYDNNRDSLAIEEHVSVWQIFLQITPEMDADAIAEMGKQAEQIANDIKANNLDYATAAIRHSRHQPSKANGGYMGLIKVTELLPGIDESLLALDEGEVSSPVRTDTGFHILKRGPILPAQEVTFEQVQDQIRNLLINQARTQIRTKINEQVSATYPVQVDEESISEWRNQLQTELQAPASDITN